MFLKTDYCKLWVPYANRLHLGNCVVDVVFVAAAAILGLVRFGMV